MLSSPAHRAGAAMLAALVLAGCSLQETGPAPDVQLPPLASGGGIISSDQGAASAPDTPPEPEPPESREDTQEDAPSFQELPSSQPPSSQPPESSSSGSSAASPPPSGSSQPPPSSSSSVPSSVAEEPEGDEEEEEPGEDEEEEEPVHSRPSRPSSGKPPEPESGGDDGGEDSASGWQELRVQSDGSTVSGSGVSIVARIVQKEIGPTYPDEAIKAQAVAAYTFVRYHNSTGTGTGSAPAVGLAASVNERVTRLVKEVAGEQITYNGKLILASYCAMSAGRTASSRSVWGRDLAYLRPVDSSVDEAESGFLRTLTLSSVQVKSKLQSALGVNLDSVAPEDWFEILSWWDDGPYVNEVRIGGTVTTTGRKLRENIFGLRSAAFEIEYDPGTDRFTFTTRGYGHGVGMSQVGAKHLANDGWDHTEILEHYYSGAQAG